MPKESETRKKNEVRVAPPLPAGRSRTTFRRMSSIFCRCVLFVFAVFCVAVLGIGMWISKYFSPIVPEKADRDRLAGWLVFRNLTEESPEIQRVLLQRYLEEFGPNSESTDMSGMKIARRFARKYTLERRAEVVDWVRESEKVPSWRCDYRIRTNRGQVPSPVVSTDIVPTKRLLGVKTANPWPPIPEARTRTERNLRLLTRLWFLVRMDQYDRTRPRAKPEFLRKTVQEMYWWQEYYNHYLVAVGMEPLGRTELLGEFKLMMAGWYHDVEPASLARLLWFRDLLVVTALRGRPTTGIRETLAQLPATLIDVHERCCRWGLSSPFGEDGPPRWLVRLAARRPTIQKTSVKAPVKASEKTPEKASAGEEIRRGTK